MKYAVGYDWESKTAAWNQQAIDYVLLGRPLSAHQVFFFLTESYVHSVLSQSYVVWSVRLRRIIASIKLGCNTER